MISRINGQKPLLIVFLVLVALLSFRIAVHLTHYTTPDSHAYLKKAEKLKGTWFQESLELTDGFALWPIGYPFLIAVVSFLTGTTVLFASKVVNFLFLGWIFALLYKYLGQKALFVSLVFFSYSALEVLSQTWTETAFIASTLWLCILVFNYERQARWGYFFLLTLALVLPFLFRYIGSVYVFAIILVGAWHLVQGRRETGLIFLGSAVCALSVFGWYLWDNLQESGTMTGEREMLAGSGFLVFQTLTSSVINELSFARKLFALGFEPLFFISTVLQVLLTGYLVLQRRLLENRFMQSELRKILIFFAGIYLTGLVPLLVLLNYPFDYRYLFPTTFFIWVALFDWIRENKQFYQKTAKWIITFVLFSAMINLPKGFILEWFFN